MEKPPRQPPTKPPPQESVPRQPKPRQAKSVSPWLARAPPRPASPVGGRHFAKGKERKQAGSVARPQATGFACASDQSNRIHRAALGERSPPAFPQARLPSALLQRLQSSGLRAALPPPRAFRRVQMPATRAVGFQSRPQQSSAQAPAVPIHRGQNMNAAPRPPRSGSRKESPGRAASQSCAPDRSPPLRPAGSPHSSCHAKSIALAPRSRREKSPQSLLDTTAAERCYGSCGQQS